LWKTTGRFFYDQLSPAEENGDVTATWDIDGMTCSTYGHVFTDKEIGKLAADSQLRIKERLVVDYETGVLRRLGFQGNLLYVFAASPDVFSVSPKSQRAEPSISQLTT
jgi:hypothetical protein